MFYKERPVYAEIDLGKVRKNIASIKERAKGKRVVSIVKADAYGHGMKEVVGALKEEGIRDFAVAILDEALTFREFDKESSILILGFTSGILAKEVIENDITASVFTYEEAELFSKEAVKLNKTVKLSIVLDTGMSRIGFLLQDGAFNKSLEDIVKIGKLPMVSIEEVYSHFSTADEVDKTYSMMQLERFLKMKREMDDAGVKSKHYHHANSAGIIDLLEDIPLDTVRPGIIQYGYYPSHDVKKERLEIEPVLSWKAKIVHIKEVEDGTFVSYGNTFKTEGKARIGTLPLGYADGYNRLLSSKGKVIYNGKMLNIIGRVCMDQMMVDLTDAPEAKPGDTVILLGNEGDLKYDADDMADTLGTISYEITCDISKRVPRKYIK